MLREALALSREGRGTENRGHARHAEQPRADPPTGGKLAEAEATYRETLAICRGSWVTRTGRCSACTTSRPSCRTRASPQRPKRCTVRRSP